MEPSIIIKRVGDSFTVQDEEGNNLIDPESNPALFKWEDETLTISMASLASYFLTRNPPQLGQGSDR